MAAGKYFWRGRFSTVDLLVLTSLDQLLLKLKILFTFFTKQATLMRRSIVVSLPTLLAFLGGSDKCFIRPSPRWPRSWTPPGNRQTHLRTKLFFSNALAYHTSADITVLERLDVTVWRVNYLQFPQILENVLKYCIDGFELRKNWQELCWHQCRKTIVLNCHGCLINTGVE